MIYYRCNELHRHQYIRIHFQKTLVRSHCNDDQFTIVTNDPDQLSGSMSNLSRWQGPSIWGGGEINAYAKWKHGLSSSFYQYKELLSPFKA